MKAWRPDLLIALAALTVGALTASSALYQSRMYSEQFSATVWPYLSFNATASPTTFELRLENDGAGPAIIDGAEVLVDGKRERSIIASLHKMKLAAPGHFLYSSLEPGEVIRAGASAMLVKVAEPHIAGLGPAYRRLEVNVYYCSLLNRCWVVRLHSSERPKEVTGQSYPHTSIAAE
jgi:hypothetical protein